MPFLSIRFHALINSKLLHTPLGNPRAFEGLFKFSPPGQKLCFNAPPNFFVKGKISGHALHVDQAFNLDLFLAAIRLQK